MNNVTELKKHYIEVRKRLMNPKPITKPEKTVETEPRLEIKMPVSQGRILLEEVAAKWGLEVSQLRSHYRKDAYVKARREFCYKARKDLNLPYQKIGSILGNKDHTTVIYAIKKYSESLNEENGLPSDKQQV